MLTHSLAYTPLTTGAMPQTARAERHEPRSLQEHLAAAPLRKIEAKQNVFAEGDRSTHIYRVEFGRDIPAPHHAGWPATDPWLCLSG